VTVYERGKSEGSQRVRIGDDEWATAVTAKGKVLLSPPEEPEILWVAHEWCTVRSALSNSSPEVRTLQKGTAVVVCERGESEGSLARQQMPGPCQRVRITDDEWVTAVTADGTMQLSQEEPQEDIGDTQCCKCLECICCILTTFGMGISKPDFDFMYTRPHLKL
jgi:hypothetical protein